MDDTDYPHSHESAHYLEYKRGKELFESKNFEKAIEHLQRSNLEYPHHKTLELIGVCYLQSGNPNHAVMYLAASALLSKHAKPAALLAEAFLKLNRNAEAVEFATLALKRNPKDRLATAVLQDLQTSADD